MIDRSWAGVLTLRGEGAEPRVRYNIVVEDRLADSPAEIAQYYTSIIRSDSTMFFALSEDEHGPDAFIVVRTERIESLVINPSDEGHDQR